MPNAANPQHTGRATSRDFAVAFLCGGFVAPMVGTKQDKLSTITLSYACHPARRPPVKESQLPEASGRI
jgi:hypothetical protein